MQKQCRVFGILRYILASSRFGRRKRCLHLHRSTGQEDTKVVCQGQMDSYYERFSETVAMGLPGRVINLDVAGLEHEADDEKEERARYETEIESEVNGYE